MNFEQLFINVLCLFMIVVIIASIIIVMVIVAGVIYVAIKSLREDKNDKKRDIDN